ncbi:hypothetical protein GCM10023201_01950 [Actinomycetospora corticicola]|uniref:Uncharacterized protein n=1 Tax=Actinomycetospora corticicola TaxID=663602 RepID=A0A7Y9E192_9PSEU|nr:hypothetical protein [Actinomycetospora corticicola]NYD39210.1 hypothetical protein [Actinomycetospora corticicola]
MTTLVPSRRRVPAPVGRLARQPWPTADVRRRPGGRPPTGQPCATADTRHQQVDTTAPRTLHDDADRLGGLVRGLLHGTVTLRRPDLLGAGLRRLCDDAAPRLTGQDRLVDDLRTAAGLAVHALESRPLALATPADFGRLARLGELLGALSAAAASGPAHPAGEVTRRREGWSARRRRARDERALFGDR